MSCPGLRRTGGSSLERTTRTVIRSPTVVRIIGSISARVGPSSTGSGSAMSRR